MTKRKFKKGDRVKDHYNKKGTILKGNYIGKHTHEHIDVERDDGSAGAGIHQSFIYDIDSIELIKTNKQK